MKPVKGGQGPVWAVAPLIIIMNIRKIVKWITIFNMTEGTERIDFPPYRMQYV
jgi:hypothetical protein